PFLKTNGWIDYESQQLFTEELFRNVPEVKTKWQNKFELIFVDEYQDTDPIQYRIVKALAESHQNLRVVGDDDQGIYGWRGADIQNILNFEKNYPNAKIISLGQNYRSTQKIVEISHALAEFNPDRRDKELFTRNFEGEKVKYLHCDNDEEEAVTIASFIQRSIDQGNWQPSDFAVLYRTNKQASAFKTALSDLGIQYHIVGNSLNVPAIGISIMTIHKSKGLEFPNVFVTGICQDLLPHY
ncbi:AAA family ATPase, partial [Candidatus Poribacteria bacterium]|nr:AAA family ATPase [Candidatus Poribacteria bacterium]